MSNKKRYDNRHCALFKGEYQRADNIYEFKWTDTFGKRHSIYAADLDELRYKEQRLELNKLEGIKEAPAGLTVESLYETWKNLKRGIKNSTFSNYIYLFEAFIRPSFGKKRVVLIKRSDVRAFYINLLEDRCVSLSTVENVHNVLQQVFQYAVDDDMLRKNPCTNVLKEIKNSYSNLKSLKKEALTLREEVNFLKYLHDNGECQRWFPTFFIMANTGLRVGELTGLRWQDVDLENGFIDVNHTLVYYNHRDSRGFYYSVNSPKTENGRRKVIITDAVKEAFLLEKQYQDDLRLKSLDEIDGYEDFIFINRFGHVQNQSTLNKAIRRIIRDFNLMLLDKGAAGLEDSLPHFSCHILRHTYATRLMESGCSIKFAQHQLGHSEIQTTMDRYVSVTDSYKHQEIRAFEEFMKLSFA